MPYSLDDILKPDENVETPAQQETPTHLTLNELLAQPGHEQLTAEEMAKIPAVHPDDLPEGEPSSDPAVEKPYRKTLKTDIGYFDSIVRTGAGAGEFIVAAATDLAGAFAGMMVPDTAGRIEAGQKGEDYSAQDFAKFITKSRDMFRYEPRTVAGQMWEGAIGGMFGLVSQFGQDLGDKAFEATGSPTVATAVRMGPDAIAMLAPFAMKGKPVIPLAQDIIDARARAANAKQVPSVHEQKVMDDYSAAHDQLQAIRTKPLDELTPEDKMAAADLTRTVDEKGKTIAATRGLDYTTPRPVDSLINKVTDADLDRVDLTKVQDIVKQAGQAAEEAKNTGEETKGAPAAATVEVVVDGTTTTITKGLDELVAAKMLGNKKILVRTVVPKPKVGAVKAMADKVYAINEAERALSDTIKERSTKTLTEKFQEQYDLTKPLKDRLRRLLPEKAWVPVVARYQQMHNAGTSATLFAKDFFEPVFTQVTGRKVYDRTLNGKTRPITDENILDEIVQSRLVVEIAKRRPNHKFSGKTTSADHQARLHQLREDIGESEFNNLNGVADQVFDVYRRLLDKRREEGLITQDLYDKLKSFDYEPRQHLEFFDPEIAQQSGKGVRSSGVMKLQDGGYDLTEVSAKTLLHDSINRTFNIIAKNRVLAELDNVIRANPNSALAAHVKVLRSPGKSKAESARNIESTAPEILDSADKLAEQVVDGSIVKGAKLFGSLVKKGSSKNDADVLYDLGEHKISGDALDYVEELIQNSKLDLGAKIGDLAVEHFFELTDSGKKRYFRIAKGAGASLEEVPNLDVGKFVQLINRKAEKIKKKAESAGIGAITSKLPKGFERVEFFNQGRKRALAVDPYIASVWKTQGEVEGLRAGTQFLRAITGVSPVKALAVGLNPLFPLVDVPRNIIGIGFSNNVSMSGRPLFGTKGLVGQTVFGLPVTSAQMLRNMAQVAGDARTHGPLFRQLADNNAFPRFLAEIGLDEFKKVNRRETAFGNLIGDKGVHYLNRVAEAMSYPGVYAETVMRMAVAKQALDRGLTLSEAAAESLRMVNFNESGYFTARADNFMPFFNAGFQASRAQFRGFKESPARTAALSASVMSMAAMNYWTNWLTNPDAVRQISDDDLSTGFNFVLPVSSSAINPDGDVVHPYVHIPANGAAVPFIAASSWMMRRFNEHREPSGMLLNAMKKGTFPLVDVTGTPLADATLAVFGNYDSFRGRALFPRDVGEPYQEYYGEHERNATPQIYVELGKLMWDSGLFGDTPLEGLTSPERLRAAVNAYIPNHPLSNVFSSIDMLADPTMRDQFTSNWEMLDKAPGIGALLHITNPAVNAWSDMETVIGEVGAPRAAAKREADEMAFMVTHNQMKMSDALRAAQTRFLSVDPQYRQELMRRIVVNVQAQRVIDRLPKDARLGLPGTSWWASMGAQASPIERARAYYKTWINANPKVRKTMDRMTYQLSGIGAEHKIIDGNGEFLLEFNKLKRRGGTEYVPGILMDDVDYSTK